MENSLQVGEGNGRLTSLVVYWGCARRWKIESKNCMFEVYNVNKYQIELLLWILNIFIVHVRGNIFYLNLLKLYIFFIYNSVIYMYFMI